MQSSVMKFFIKHALHNTPCTHTKHMAEHYTNIQSYSANHTPEQLINPLYFVSEAAAGRAGRTGHMSNNDIGQVCALRKTQCALQT
jgi:hypothetical protein